tara:strand:- start:919 stop:1125 length:207 start_codon:yes stop_codon:yes gene_type:complete
MEIEENKSKGSKSYFLIFDAGLTKNEIITVIITKINLIMIELGISFCSRRSPVINSIVKPIRAAYMHI